MNEDLYDFDGPAPATTAPAAPVQAPVARLSRSDGARPGRVKMDTTGAFLLGVSDTVTFGYLDELGAGADWLFLGKDYKTALEQNRAILHQAEEEHGGSYFAGQLGGALVPIGWAGRVKQANEARKAMTGLKAAQGMMIAGAVQGAIYGSGASEGDLYDRFKGALAGGIFGAGGGLVLGGAIMQAGWAANKASALFRHGKPQKLLEEFAPNVFVREADEATASALKAAKKEAGPLPKEKARTVSDTVETGPATPKTRNVITGAADDVLEDGALLSTKELTGDVNVARNAIRQRVSKMTTDQAILMAKRLEQAELNGDIINDPHYRSLLGIDIEGSGVDRDTALRAAELLEEATDAILEKAGMGRTSYKKIEQQFEQRFAGELTQDEMDEAVHGMSDVVMHVRVADHVSMLAAVQLSKARSALLPEVLKGAEGARDRLTQSVADAVSLMSQANYVKAQAGRALNSLKMKGKMAFDEVVDDASKLEAPEAIRARVEESLKALGDHELSEMLARLRNPKDVENALKTLMNPEDAAKVGNYLRTQRTVTAFIKSNLLTPASAVRNTVGFVLHDLYRNHWARRWAANAYEMAGKTEEAMAMRFELEVANAVYWKTHAAGFKAMVERIKWDHWSTVERRGILLGRDVSGVQKKKADLLASGYQPTEIREFDLQARAKVMDPKAFDAQMRELEAKGGFSAIWAAAQRAGAAGLEQLDAAGTATAKVISGALDSWGRSMITLKETYALSARYAVREGIALGLPEDEMRKFVSRRAVELAELPPVDLLDEVERKLVAREEVPDDLKFAMGVQSRAEKEADISLFLDGPQSKGGRIAAAGMGMADTAVSSVVSLGLARGLLTPYVKTPTRILETGLVKYTPWGGRMAEVQKVLERGGPDAMLETARMEMGTMAIGLGVMLGAANAVTITNGGWKNSANLHGAPANRLNLPGGGYMEMTGIDPFSFSIGIGASIGQAIQAYQQSGQMGLEAQEAIEGAIATAYLGIRDAVLEKSYLTGLKEASQAIFSQNEKDPTAALFDFAEKKLGTFAQTMVPASGTARQIADTVRGNQPEAVGIVDQLLRLVPVPDILPTKVDFLGEETDGRKMGFAVGDKQTGEGDTLRDQLAAAGIQLSDVERRDRAGFDLTGEQLTKLRKLRATEATNRYGQNLREALTDLMNSPEFQTAPTRTARQEMFTDAMDGFTKSARELLEEQDPNFAAKRVGHKSLAAYIAEGMSRDQARRQATSDTMAEGLPDPNL